MIDPTVTAALDRLAAIYAAAVDDRDVERFLSAFTPDAVLEVDRGAGAPPSVRTGHTELAVVPTALDRYERTFHLLGQALYEADGDEVTGLVYCTARHLTGGPHPVDETLHIRYRDRYRMTDDGWRIGHRVVGIEWTASAAVDHDR